VASASTEVDDIKREMAQLRMTLHHDVRGVVAGAEAVSDWRHYVRLYPWICLSVAFGAGFLVVPARRRSIHKTVEAAATAAAEKVQDTVVGQINAKGAESHSRSGLFGTVLAFLAPMAVRAAQNLAIQYVESVITRQRDDAPAGPSEPLGKSHY
jgi:hypothetical protein